MIFDNIKNARYYMNISPGFEKAFRYILDTPPEEIRPGRVELDGDNVYAVCFEYETKADAKWEAHRKYIDLQFILEGSETMHVSEKSFMAPSDEYNPEKDIQFFEGEPMVSLKAFETDFAVFFPEDIHKPGLRHSSFESVKKVVVKIHV